MIHRHETFEERNAISAALDFYIKNGPEETIVANYDASYPNDPEKAIRVFNREDYIALKKEWEASIDKSGEIGYEGMLDNLLMIQADDYYDIKALRDALIKGYDKLTIEMDKILSESESGY